MKTDTNLDFHLNIKFANPKFVLCRYYKYPRKYILEFLTFPQTYTTIISWWGKNSACDIPADTPNLRLMVIKHSYLSHLKFVHSTVTPRCVFPGEKENPLAQVFSKKTIYWQCSFHKNSAKYSPNDRPENWINANVKVELFIKIWLLLSILQGKPHFLTPTCTNLHLLSYILAASTSYNMGCDIYFVL